MNPLWLGVLMALLAVYAGLVWFAFSTARKVERLVPPLGQFVEVQGVRLHYVEHGSGPVTVLCIHGLAGNARHFAARVLEPLSRHFRVVALDRPGAGYSAPLGDTPTPQAQAALMAAFIDALGLGQPVVVGHSLGGAVALALASGHPERVGALALLAPLTQHPKSVPPVFAALAIRGPLVRTMIGWTLAVPLSIARRDAVLSVVFGPEPVPDDFGLAAGGLLGMRPSAFTSASTDLAAADVGMSTLVERHATVQAPVGILYGTHDRILQPAMHGNGLLAQIPHATLELVERAGHMLPLTAPERVVAFVHEVAGRRTTAASV
ncbi:MAG: alpha/beta fold hydrolase [Gemmatimonas sp.]|jgi:pimeloyl-ACP methyl ester carboxylesterase|uniref:alpha/beta fold hydrolase n=1 Tax=Gemmatimonas sp. TaxID=1962908 RepID=UPI0025BEE981|nr:alpha/beta fold hydrolase [Gemmatimonas sp.]MCA2987646.1 alpha/beta fold hydrolase [Gemmatimonas sp.]